MSGQFKSLSVRVLDFFPRFGGPGERLTTILDRCPDLLDLNIKIGIGMKVLDTVPWISKEFSQLSASIPPFHETGWFDTKVPLYVLSLSDDGGMEIPIQSWCFGQFEYKLDNQVDFHPPQAINISNYSLSTPNINPGFVDHNLNSGIQMNYSNMHMHPEINCFPMQDFNEHHDNNPSLNKPHSLSQQVLQRVESTIGATNQEPAISEPCIPEMTNITYSAPIPTPDNNVVPPFLNDLFFLPTYQPRLRMSTYTTHLRSSLENADYFPEAFPLDSHNQFWLLPHEDHNNNNHCNELIASSSYNMDSTFADENIQNCTSFDKNLEQTVKTEKPPLSHPEPNLPQVSETIQPIHEVSSTPSNNSQNKKQQLSNGTLKRANTESQTLEATPSKKPKDAIKIPIDSTNTQSDRSNSKTSDCLPENENLPLSGRSFVKLQPKPSETATQLPPRKSSDPDVQLINKNISPHNIPNKGQTHPLYLGKPFHGVLNRAELVLTTDVSVMVQDWTPQEIEAGRRLLKFYRRHEENTLYCHFEPISYEEYLRNQSASVSNESPGKKIEVLDQMVISVIYWSGPSIEADGPALETSYYITSVDLVNLLEGLLGVVFTLEEKNRIRRNMELFNPITVGKGAHRTGELFKRIMAFPAPRPRNIEKGIKVFPFDRLPQALHKVVSKHTASRSSTLKVNLLPLETPSLS